MKRFVFIVTLLASSAALAWQTSSSIRAPDGKIINRGDTKAGVLLRLGPPAARDVQSVGVDIGLGRGSTTETWSYIIKGNIYTIKFDGDRISRIDHKRY